MESKQYIIGGIDTDCGKTYVTGQIAKKILNQGKKIITSKLIQTGCNGVSEDIIEHRKIMGIDLLPEDKSGLTCPIVFSYPASPHLAAEIDKKDIDLNLITKSNNELLKTHEIVLTEAAGGLMVPLTRNYLTIDYIKEQNLPVILVTSSKLGSINHTLLSIELCIQKGIELPIIIYNQFPEHDKMIAEDSFCLLKEYIKEKSLNSDFIHINDIKEENTILKL